MTMSTSKDIRVPRRSSGGRVAKALKNVAQDGNWQRVLDMGFSSAEQTARAYNIPGGQWEFGYSHEQNDGGELISVLWAKWIG